MVYFPKWKAILVIAICAAGFLFALPNVLSRTTLDALPAWLPHKQVSLGLDLQGGSHLLLEVETDAVVRELLESLVDRVRGELREARIQYTGLGVQRRAVVVTIRDAGQVDDALQRLRDLREEAVVEVGEAGRLELRFSEQVLRDREASAVQRSVEIIRRRIDETGVREPTIQPHGESRILVQLPGVEDPERMKDILGQTAKMTFHLVDPRAVVAEAVVGQIPPGTMLIPAADDLDQPQMYVVSRRAVVSGESLVDAEPTFQEGQPVVSFRFDTKGAMQFGEVTRANVGQFLAIVLDGKVISAPRIREPILGGSGVITGNFTTQQAQDLALLLRAGALPAPLTILEERVVGPGLGADSIAAGQVASGVGVALVAIFMVVAYGLFGLFSILALVVNLVLLLAVLSVLQATLTLPGIAGIVLTVGMAVDANVLIFERIREEVRAGRTPISAVDIGYSRAFGTIIDSNVTTLIAAVLLYIFGSGPIRGFAVTLSIGIAISMFTAIMLTRLLVVMWLRRRRAQPLPV
jgi:preprotein translocase subunit SecD